jgi:outer membrane immunogenic protein
MRRAKGVIAVFAQGVSMKKLLLAGVALGVLTASEPAFAAGRMPQFNWTGCYVGGHVGGGWGQQGWRDAPNSPPGFDVFFIGTGTAQDKTNGFLGGGQIGCDYQFAPGWVVGFEGQFSVANINGGLQSPFFGGKASSLSAKTDWLANATGRVGYGWDRWLLYVRGGAAWAHDKYDIFHGSDFSATESQTGWTLGGGVEWMFLDNWSTKLEYQYYDFGGRDVTMTSPSDRHTLLHIDQTIHTVKLGVNYRFWPGR